MNPDHRLSKAEENNLLEGINQFNENELKKLGGKHFVASLGYQGPK